MNDSQRRKFDKTDREDAFMIENTADFPTSTKGELLSVQINAERSAILAFDAQQTSGFDDKRQAQAIYDDLRDEAIDLIDKMVLAAQIVDDDLPGTAEKYKKPYPRNDQNIIAKLTSFHADSADKKAAFNDAEFTFSDRDRLLTVRDEFQQAGLTRDTSEERHAEATGGMTASFHNLMDLSRRRDKVVRMKYRNNAAKLAAWTVASHLDRAPNRAPKVNKNEGGNNNENPPS
ncbi:hypothetical protein BH10ACI1_BH10ACI1_05170 [soil metagenome]